MSSAKSVKDKFHVLAPYFNEKVTRLWAAIEAMTIGRGGITIVSRATGLSPKTIRVGIRELEQESNTLWKQTRTLSKIRKQGGGRKRLIDINPSLIKELEVLMNPSTAEGYQSVLRWTCKSTAEIASELQAKDILLVLEKLLTYCINLTIVLAIARRNKEILRCIEIHNFIISTTKCKIFWIVPSP